jgi:cyclic beta-1,2-glucan synthetase
VHYRYRETIYHIKVVQGHAGEDEGSVTVDGVVQREQAIPLVDDNSEHFIGVVVVPIRLCQV